MKKLLILTTMLGLGLQCYYSLNLPGMVATHFGPGGIADGGLTNTSNLVFNSLVLVVVAILYLVTPFVLSKAPLELIAFPNRKYWLAPKRLERTLPVIADWLWLSGLLTIVFLLAVYHLIFIANQTQPPWLDQARFMLLFKGYLFLMLLWLVALLIRFGRTLK